MGDDAPPSLKTEFFPALTLHALFFIFAGSTNFPPFGQVCEYAFLAFWIAVAVLNFHRRGVLTKVDLFFIRYGFFPVCVLSFFLTRWIWHLRGYDYTLL